MRSSELLHGEGLCAGSVQQAVAHVPEGGAALPHHQAEGAHAEGLVGELVDQLAVDVRGEGGAPGGDLDLVLLAPVKGVVDDAELGEASIDHPVETDRLPPQEEVEQVPAALVRGDAEGDLGVPPEIGVIRKESS